MNTSSGTYWKEKADLNRGHVAHLLSATVRVYSLVAPCRLPDLTSLALLGSGSGQRGLSRGPLPGYKTVSKWRLQLQDSIPFLLLSQRFCTTLHTSASSGCYLLFTLMPDCPLTPLSFTFHTAHDPGSIMVDLGTHLLSATVRVYSLVAPCRLPDLTSLALLGSVSGQRRFSKGPLPGFVY